MAPANQPNSNFLFYKAVGLKALVQARGITLENGKKKTDNMIKALADGRKDEQVPETITAAVSQGTTQDHEQKAKDLATQAILEKSFLPHRKKKAREHYSLGH